MAFRLSQIRSRANVLFFSELKTKIFVYTAANLVVFFKAIVHTSTHIERLLICIEEIELLFYFVLKAAAVSIAFSIIRTL